MRVVFVHDSDRWLNADKIYEINSDHERIVFPSNSFENNYKKESSMKGAPRPNSAIDIDDCDDEKSAKIEFDVYRNYLNLFQFWGIIVFVIMILCYGVFQFIIVKADIWISNW